MTQAPNSDLQIPAANKKELLAAFIHQVRSERARARRVEILMSWARLAVFAILVVLWLALSLSRPWLYGFSIALAILFALCVGRHHKARARRKIMDHLLTICGECGRRLGGQVALVRGYEPPKDAPAGSELDPFFADGTTWTLTGQERGDLDFHEPPVGLFGLLNRTSTLPGCRRLLSYMGHLLLSVERIRSRQSAVQYLAENPRSRWRIMASLASGRLWGKEFDKFVLATRNASQVLPSGVSVSLRIWSLISFFASFYFIYQAGSGVLVFIYAFVGLFFLNSMIYRQIKGKLDAAVKPWKNVAPAVAAFAVAARTASDELADSSALSELRDALKPVADRAVLPALFSALGWTESGGMFHVISNLLYFFNLHVVEAVHRRVLPHRDALLHGVAGVAEIDALCSLGSFAWEQPLACIPELKDEPIVTIRGGCHPLIAPEIAVPNEVTLDMAGRIWIVTGSNMAGKSTLLRMAGVNTVLAQMGSVVCAESMSLSPLRLITDLQAHDSLADGESYFLAEVRHLRRLVLPPEGSAPLLGIVDEPLRGTNSREQTAAGIAVVEHLKDEKQFFLIATHEQEITKLGDGGVIRNMHFREKLEDDGMIFDYRLRSGPARTRNALRVLDREGFPDHVLERAYAWLKQTGDEEENRR